MTDDEEVKWLDEVHVRLITALRETPDSPGVQSLNGQLQAIANMRKVRSELREKALTFAITKSPGTPFDKQVDAAEAYYNFLRG